MYFDAFQYQRKVYCKLFIIAFSSSCYETKICKGIYVAWKSNKVVVYFGLFQMI